MAYLWDYNEKELEKSEQGRILLLERQINYGVYMSDKIKIKLSDVKKYWNKLKLEPSRRKLFNLLLWEK